MGWLEGVLTGYAGRHYEIEKQKREDAAKAAEREERVFSTLLNSPYKDIREFAGAGILDLANPRKRKGGVAGWMGEMEGSPYLDAVRRTQSRLDTEPGYAEENQVKPYYPWLGQGGDEQGGAPPSTPSIPTPAGSVAAAPSAALPSTSLVEGGQGQAPTPAPPPPAWAGVTPPTFASPSGVQPGVPQAASPQAAGGAPGAPPQPGPGMGSLPPPSLLGPPLPVAEPPPTPPGVVSAGLPGATTRSVGRQTPPRAARTQLPGIFPTQGDLQRDQARSAVSGKIDGYADMYMAQGFSEQEAYKKAADLLEQDLLSSRGSALQNMAMEFDVTHADGRTERVLGWQDRRSQQFVDINGRPFGPDVKVSKAAPYSSFGGDVWSRMAANNLGIHPGQVANNPVLAQQVETLADQLAGGRAYRTSRDRGQAASENPLTSGQRVNQIAEWQSKYNAYQTPLRLMELYLRNASAAYAELKAGRTVAWEPFRTAFVHVNEAGSVVMPSEFSRAGGIGSLVERVKGQVEQWMQGGGPLPQDLIDDMMHVAAAQWDAVQNYDQNFRSQVDEALKDPALAGVRPEQIFGGPKTRFDPWSVATPPPPSATPPPPPAGGTVPPGATGAYYDPKTRTFIIPPKPQ